MSQTAESFKDNYQKLQEIAQKLANSGEVDIDELVPMVDDATRAYQLCKSRIEAVESALNTRLDNETGNDSGNESNKGSEQ
ncbi:exodeoxyribonuclease VII small subunit [Thiomicrorhabdus sp. Milos-T2]|uniref:exodeoxyribonuclease VII small subunit n=1 Tax=Thiomicrorhabdus sp. Milos-T2 TaxID=90814 RepID=UPI000494B7AC|nr:exodeoxyribonuclease VII small subunit [Thiomicrorhabdus sp. Milos-T2]